MGDPAGIGPEISAKVFEDSSLYQKCRPLLVGDADIMEQAIKIVQVPLTVRAISAVEDAQFQYGIIDVLHIPCIDLSELNKKESVIKNRFLFSHISHYGMRPYPQNNRHQIDDDQHRTSDSKQHPPRRFLQNRLF